MNTEILILSRWLRLLFIVVTIMTLSACSVTNPYWGQELASQNAQIPLQIFTPNKTAAINIECAPYNYWANEDPNNFSYVTGISPEPRARLEHKDDGMYHASKKVVLPDNCWNRFYVAAGEEVLAAAIRIRQEGNNHPFADFDENGLACLGKAIGEALSWYGWHSRICTHNYYNSNIPVPYVMVWSYPK